jgi:transposase
MLQKKFGDTLWCNFALRENYALDCLQEVPEKELQKVEISHFHSRWLCAVCADKFRVELKGEKIPEFVPIKPKRESDKTGAQDVESFLLNEAPNMFLDDIKQDLIDIFNLSLTHQAIRQRLKNLGVSYKLKIKRGQPDQKQIIFDILKANEGLKTPKELQKELQKHFNIQTSAQNIIGYAKRHDIKILNDRYKRVPEQREIIIKALQSGENKKTAKQIQEDLMEQFNIDISIQNIIGYSARHNIQILRERPRK